MSHWSMYWMEVSASPASREGCYQLPIRQQAKARLSEVEEDLQGEASQGPMTYHCPPFPQLPPLWNTPCLSLTHTLTKAAQELKHLNPTGIYSWKGKVIVIGFLWLRCVTQTPRNQCYFKRFSRLQKAPAMRHNTASSRVPGKGIRIYYPNPTLKSLRGSAPFAPVAAPEGLYYHFHFLLRIIRSFIYGQPWRCWAPNA